MNEPRSHRYPGAQPFQDAEVDRRLFRGREAETKALANLILAEQLVVLYAKSGMGKSSLLNAGVAELLRRENLLPLSVRVNDHKAGPYRTIYEGIEEAAKRQGVELVAGDTSSLSDYFRTVELWQDDVLLTPALILDQFEELFTLHARMARVEFAGALAGLLRAKASSDEDGRGRSLPLRVVISLREDFLGHLEELAPRVPGILHSRFRLGPLGRDAARRSIAEPAALEERIFATPPFTYSAEALNGILDFLCTRRGRDGAVSGEEVEPFQLQLICQHVELLVAARPAAADARPVEYSDLGGAAGLQMMLRRFYDDQIAAIGTSAAEIHRLRRLCEEGLINEEGRRRSVEEPEIRSKWKVGSPMLARLVDRRLLRSEERVGSTYYELSHDTLLAPIGAARGERRRRRNRWAGAAIALGLAGVGGWFALGQKRAGLDSEASRIDAQWIASAPDAALLSALDVAGRSLRLPGELSPNVTTSLARAVSGARLRSVFDALPSGRIATAAAVGDSVVIVGDQKGGLHVFDLGGQQLAPAQTVLEGNPVLVLTLSPDGDRFACAGSGGRLEIRTVGGGRVGPEVRFDEAAITAVAFHPGGKGLVAAGSSGRLHLYSFAQGEVGGEVGWHHDSAVTALAFDELGAVLRTAANDGGIAEWSFAADWKAGAVSLELKNVLSHPTDRVVTGAGWLAMARSSDSTIQLVALSSAGKGLGDLKIEPTRPPTALAFNVDGSRIAVGMDGGYVEVYEVRKPTMAATGAGRKGRASGALEEGGSRPPETGDGAVDQAAKRLWYVSSPGNYIGGLAFDPTDPRGETVLVGESDGAITVLSKDNEVVAKIGNQGASVTALAISGDGKTIVTAGEDRSLSGWSLQRRARLFTNKRPSTVQALVMIPHSRLFLVADADGGVEILDFAGRVLAAIPTAGGRITAVAVDPAGKRIVTGRGRGAVEVWPWSGNSIGTPTPLPGSEAVTGVVVDDAGGIIRGTIDLSIAHSDGRQDFAPAAVFAPFKATVAPAQIGFAVVGRSDPSEFSDDGYVDREGLRSLRRRRDGKLLVSTYSTGDLRLWNSNGDPLGGPLKGGADIVWADFGADGLVSVGNDGSVRVWDAPGLGMPNVDPEVQGDRLAISPSGGLYATMSNSAAVTLRDLRSDRKLAMGTMSEECGNGSNLVFSPEGGRLAFGCDDGGIGLMNTAFEMLPRWPVPARGGGPSGAGPEGEDPQPVTTVAADPAGRFFATGDGLGMLRLWSPIGEPLEPSRNTKQRAITAVAVSPDGRWIATAGDKTVRVFDRSAQEPVKTLADAGQVHAIAWSPDGRRLAFGGEDRLLRIWEWRARGAPVVRPHENPVTSVAFSPDGTRLASACAVEVDAGSDSAHTEYALHLWDPTGRSLSDPLLTGYENSVEAVFTDNGDSLLASGGGLEGHVWKASPRGWIVGACERLALHPRMRSPQTSSERRARATCDRVAWAGHSRIAITALTADAAAVDRVAAKAAALDRADPRHRAPLHLAVLAGSQLVVARLLEKGANPDPLDGDEMTPLALASRDGRYDIVRVLLHHHADPRLADELGAAPLLHAAARGHTAVVDLLMRSGADPNRANRYGGTPLMAAASGGHYWTTRTLLDRGAAIDAQDMVGGTALHAAARNLRLEVVKLLLSRGSDVDHENEARMTPLAWARNGEAETNAVEEALLGAHPRVTEPFPPALQWHLRRYLPAAMQPIAGELSAWQAGTAGDKAPATFRRILALAGDGSPFAQVLVGRALAEGLGVAKDQRAAVAWYRKSADQGDSWGHLALGLTAWSGVGGPQDVAAAAKSIEAAANQGNPLAMLYLSDMYQRGIGVTAASERAVALTAAAAKSGDPNTLDHEAVDLADEDLGAALARLLRAANDGDSTAFRTLGTLYLEPPPQRSLAKAMEYYRRAVEVPTIYWFGWRRAAAGEAELSIGNLYEHGLGVPASRAEAMAWYRRGALAGSAASQRRLAHLLQFGGPASNRVEAAYWYRKAWAHGELGQPWPLDAIGQLP